MKSSGSKRHMQTNNLYHKDYVPQTKDYWIFYTRIELLSNQRCYTETSRETYLGAQNQKMLVLHFFLI